MSNKQSAMGALLTVILAGVLWLAYQGISSPEIKPASYNEALRYNTSPRDTAMYFDIAHSGDVLIAVGGAGKIKRSTDGGESWTTQQLPTDSTLLTVTFSTDDTVFVAGHQGTLLKSDDKGKSWQNIPLDTGIDLPQEFVIFDSLLASNDVIYLTGNQGVLLYSTDGGMHFKQQSVTYSMSNSHLYSIRELSSGELAIVSSAGNIDFSTPSPSTEWESVRVSWSQPLLGLIEEKDGALMAFGTEGSLYRREASGSAWNHVEMPTKADIYTGIVDEKGTVSFAGSNGVVVRGDDNHTRFFIDSEFEHGAIMAMLALENDKVLLAGQGGVFRFHNGHYTSVDSSQSRQGEFVNQQLVNLPLTQHILSLASPPNRRRGTSYEAGVDKLSSGWLSFELTFDDANSSSNESKGGLLAPATFTFTAAKVKELSDMLGVQSGLMDSVWTGGLDYTLMSTYLNAGNFVINASPDDYELADQHALQNTLATTGYNNIYVSDDGAWAKLTVKESYLSLEEREALSGYKYQGNDKWKKEKTEDNRATPRAEELAAIFDDNTDVSLSAINWLTVSKVYDSSQPGLTRRAENHLDAPVVAYTISISDDTESCENQFMIAAAMALETPINSLKETGSVITVAHRSSWLRAIDHDANWKWFAPGATNRAMREGFFPWGDNMCPRTAMLVYTRPDSQGILDALTHTIKQTLSEKALRINAEDLVIRGFSLTEKPLLRSQ